MGDSDGDGNVVMNPREDRKVQLNNSNMIRMIQNKLIVIARAAKYVKHAHFQHEHKSTDQKLKDEARPNRNQSRRRKKHSALAYILITSMTTAH